MESHCTDSLGTIHSVGFSGSKLVPRTASFICDPKQAILFKKTLGMHLANPFTDYIPFVEHILYLPFSIWQKLTLNSQLLMLEIVIMLMLDPNLPLIWIPTIKFSCYLTLNS